MSDKAREAAPQLEICPDVEKAIEDADIVLHLTEWPMYQRADPAALRAHVRRPVMLDARNTLPHDRWQDAGWTVRALGISPLARPPDLVSPSPPRTDREMT
jgi:UDPglucose 6-dehydrogenase